MIHAAETPKVSAERAYFDGVFIAGAMNWSDANIRARQNVYILGEPEVFVHQGYRCRIHWWGDAPYLISVEVVTW